jgi:uncharacterized damage-inducible protein DinB
MAFFLHAPHRKAHRIMATQASHIAIMLEYIGRDVLLQLHAVPEAQLNQPVDLEAANTLFALATHLVGAGEDWVLHYAGGRTINRDRAAEFTAAGTLADLQSRYDRWIAAVHEVLDNMPDAEMDRVVEAHPTFLVWTSNAATTVRDCLLHAVAHSALHQGHIQLTCQLLTQHKGVKSSPAQA